MWTREKTQVEKKYNSILWLLKYLRYGHLINYQKNSVKNFYPFIGQSLLEDNNYLGHSYEVWNIMLLI